MPNVSSTIQRIYNERIRYMRQTQALMTIHENREFLASLKMTEMEVWTYQWRVEGIHKRLDALLARRARKHA